MKVIVVGAGLIGLTTAYALHRRGCQVSLVDRCEGPGQETSFANGGLLTPSMSEPWNTPGCWRTLLSSLVRADAPLQLRWRALPSLATWGVQFLRHARPDRFARSLEFNLRLALFSLQRMQALREQTGIDYEARRSGALKLYRDGRALDRAVATTQPLRKVGLKFQTLSNSQITEIEPALAPIMRQLAGGLYFDADESGDAYQFCQGLAQTLQALGADFRFGTTVSQMLAAGPTIASIQTTGGEFTADHYVVAAGSYSEPLLRTLGIKIPVRPAKGYSLTLERPAGYVFPRIPLVDDSLHAALTPLHGSLRVAGTAEFAGFDRTLRPERVGNLAWIAQQILPRVKLNSGTARPWCGLRAMSADGAPIIGPTPVANLWVNTGHGHLGWTLAAGSAELLADQICGVPPAIDPIPYFLRV
jgi:D-amino-acid dehydrogenase